MHFLNNRWRWCVTLRLLWHCCTVTAKTDVLFYLSIRTRKWLKQKRGGGSWFPSTQSHFWFPRYSEPSAPRQTTFVLQYSTEARKMCIVLQNGTFANSLPYTCDRILSFYKAKDVLQYSQKLLTVLFVNFWFAFCLNFHFVKDNKEQQWNQYFELHYIARWVNSSSLSNVMGI